MDSKKPAGYTNLSPEEQIQIQIEHDVALSEALIRIQALEQLLVRAGLLTEDQIQVEVKTLADKIMASVRAAQQAAATDPSLDIGNFLGQINAGKKTDPNSSN